MGNGGKVATMVAGVCRAIKWRKAKRERKARAGRLPAWAMNEVAESLRLALAL
jgi:hypothetical protein